MRIRDAYTRLDTTGVTGAATSKADARAKKAEKAAEPAIAGGATKVAVSARALEMSSSPKIAALKQAIDAGTYKVDAKAVAARMVPEDEP